MMKKSTVEEDEEEEEEEGGIDIAAARQRMLEEDKIDKQIYRERIKQKHRVWISYARKGGTKSACSNHYT